MDRTLQDDMFTPNVIADPYDYYGRLRDEDPVHWNEKYELWVVTRHDDLVWLTRHHELFSSAVFKTARDQPIRQSMSRTSAFTNTCAITWATSSSNMTVRTIWRCARSSTATSRHNPWRSGGRSCRGQSSICSMRLRTKGEWT